MKCEDYIANFDDLLDEETNSNDYQSTEKHLLDCAGCATIFESRKQEKDLFSRYLFDVEPPKNLTQKFLLALDSENPVVAVETAEPVGIIRSIQVALASFRLPVFAAVALVLVLGMGLILTRIATSGPELPGIAAEKSNPGTSEIEVAQIPVKLPTGIPQSSPEAVSAPRRARNEEQTKTNAAAVTKTQRAIRPESTMVAQLKPDEQLQLMRFRTLENDAARQLEKVELLLRGFRNVRYTEGSDKYDLSYEKQQARKLLATNIELRQRAESYGTQFTEEILNRVEPYLLDIANIENNPSADQISELKQRVQSQNIIASLQSF